MLGILPFMHLQMWGCLFHWCIKIRARKPSWFNWTLFETKTMRSGYIQIRILQVKFRRQTRNILWESSNKYYLQQYHIFSRCLEIPNHLGPVYNHQKKSQFEWRNSMWWCTSTGLGRRWDQSDRQGNHLKQKGHCNFISLVYSICK